MAMALVGQSGLKDRAGITRVQLDGLLCKPEQSEGGGFVAEHPTGSTATGTWNLTRAIDELQVPVAVTREARQSQVTARDQDKPHKACQHRSSLLSTNQCDRPL